MICALALLAFIILLIYAIYDDWTFYRGRRQR